jgi:hypothetical protein
MRSQYEDWRLEAYRAGRGWPTTTLLSALTQDGET